MGTPEFLAWLYDFEQVPCLLWASFACQLNDALELRSLLGLMYLRNKFGGV